MSENNEETNTVIDTLDKDLQDIENRVNTIIAVADNRKQLNAGSRESPSQCHNVHIFMRFN